jgi:hypothetical protein
MVGRHLANVVLVGPGRPTSSVLCPHVSGVAAAEPR